MSNADYNPFLKRNTAPPPEQPPVVGNDLPPPQVDWQDRPAQGDPQNLDAADDESELQADLDDSHESADLSGSSLPFQYVMDGHDRSTKWFWTFAPAAFITTILITMIVQLVVARLLARQLDFGVSLLTAAGIGVVYGAMHATWRMRKLCNAIHIDEQAIILTFGSRHETTDPLAVDALMTLSGIDLNGEGKGFSNLRSIVMLSGAKAQKISFEPISNARIFTALREACQHAWAIPAEGTLLPPAEIAEHHADRAGIDSLRRLRKYYGNFVMQLTFSSVSLIVLLIGGGVLLIASIGWRQMRGSTIRALLFAGGMVLAALSSLRRLPREFGILRKIKETEKSLAVALGIDFAR